LQEFIEAYGVDWKDGDANLAFGFNETQ